jgi:hypothetical protein
MVTAGLMWQPEIGPMVRHGQQRQPEGEGHPEITNMVGRKNGRAATSEDKDEGADEFRDVFFHEIPSRKSSLANLLVCASQNLIVVKEKLEISGYWFRRVIDENRFVRKIKNSTIKIGQLRFYHWRAFSFAGSF